MKGHASGWTFQRSTANGRATTTPIAERERGRGLGVLRPGNDQVPEGMDHRRRQDDRERVERHLG